MIYEECGNHRGQQCTRSSFFYLPAIGLTNMDVFSLKPFASQGESFQLTRFSRFREVREQTSKQTNSLTHSLTDWRFYRVINIQEV